MEVEADGFTVLSSPHTGNLYDEYAKITSAKVADVDNQLQGWLRKNHPELNLTVVPASNCPLLQFAYAGNAVATLESSKDEPVIRWRGYVNPVKRGGRGALGDATYFAKYHYVWGGEDFVMYTVGSGYQCVQYILKEPDSSKGEDAFSHSAIVDKLIVAAADFSVGDENKFIYIYDQYWKRSQSLWESVQKAKWDDVILDPKQKKALRSLSHAFFDSKETYERYGVPWKRGLIFYGPPGNGKTISTKALMHELYDREHPIPTLYVKSAPSTYHIRAVFTLARQFSPCLLVMEDIETIVTSSTRSYFFNEVDGLENNDGIMMVASTNYIDRLDPGLSRRPSRFDRKYLFPLPDKDERVLYAEYWRGKLAKSAPEVKFPEKLCGPIAEITNEFSFAYMQEAFVSALLELARNEANVALGESDDDMEDDTSHSDAADVAYGYDGWGGYLDRYKLWVALKRSVAVLREDLDDGEGEGEQGSSHSLQVDVDESLEPELGYDILQERQRYSRSFGLPIHQGSPRDSNPLRHSNNPSAGSSTKRRSDPSRCMANSSHEVPPQHESASFPFSGPVRSNPSLDKPESKTPRQATEQELYAAGVAKYPYIAEAAYEHKKCPW